MAIAELTATGLKIPTAQEILSDIQTQFKDKFGSDFDVSSDDIGGILIGIMSERESNYYELLNTVFYSNYPDTAEGNSLDNASSLTGISRLDGQKSRVIQCKLSTDGASNVLIPTGTQVKQSTTGVIWQTIQDVIIPASSYVVTEVQSLDYGAFTASIGSIDTIVSVINGFDSVENLTEALLGRKIETDSELRKRRDANLVVSKGGILEAIVNRVKNEVANVTYCSGQENDTSAVVGDLQPNSILITVMGGTDEDIAKTILQSKAAGMGTNGSTAVTVLDDYGNNRVIKFNRVTSLPIYLIVNVTKDSNYPSDGATQIKNLLVDYFNTFENGQDVINWRLLGILEPIAGITDLEILQDTAPTPTTNANIVVSNSQKATLTISHITVNEI